MAPKLRDISPDSLFKRSPRVPSADPPQDELSLQYYMRVPSSGEGHENRREKEVSRKAREDMRETRKSQESEEEEEETEEEEESEQEGGEKEEGEVVDPGQEQPRAGSARTNPPPSLTQRLPVGFRRSPPTSLSALGERPAPALAAPGRVPCNNTVLTAPQAALIHRMGKAEGLNECYARCNALLRTQLNGAAVRIGALQEQLSALRSQGARAESSSGTGGEKSPSPSTSDTLVPPATAPPVKHDGYRVRDPTVCQALLARVVNTPSGLQLPLVVDQGGVVLGRFPNTRGPQKEGSDESGGDGRPDAKRQKGPNGSSA